MPTQPAQPRVGIRPLRHLVIVTCMDARIDPLGLLGLQLGDAHVLRNPGGVVTDDVLFGIVVSQRRAGTVEVAVIQHTDCAIHDLDTARLGAEIEAETGRRPTLALRSFSDIDDSVRASLARLRSSRELPHRTTLAGYVFDVESHDLRAVKERGTLNVHL